MTVDQSQNKTLVQYDFSPRILRIPISHSTGLGWLKSNGAMGNPMANRLLASS